MSDRDGNANGHGTMMYSQPSRELIADACEYMANADAIDAMICPSDYNKITPAKDRSRSVSNGPVGAQFINHGLLPSRVP